MAHFGGHRIEGCACLRILHPALCARVCLLERCALCALFVWWRLPQHMCVVLDPNTVWCSRKHLGQAADLAESAPPRILAGPKHIRYRVCLWQL